MPTADEVLNEVTREHLSKFRSTAGLSYALATRCAAAESRLAEVESERDNWIDDARRYATNAAHHERERDTLRAASADWQWNYEEQVKLVAKLRAEVEDYKRAHETVMNERCAPDEMHCTCVPVLRREIEALRALARSVVAGIDSWEASVEKIIGREPRVYWGALEELRAALAAARAAEGEHE